MKKESFAKRLANCKDSHGFDGEKILEEFNNGIFTFLIALLVGLVLLITLNPFL